MSYAILTDSASNLTKELLEQYQISMISFSYLHNEKTEKCYSSSASYEELGHDFYEGLKNGEVYKTSLPAPGEYVEFFTEVLKQGQDLIYISLSGGLSGTFNAAELAKKMLLEQFPERKIEVIDAQSASFGQGLLVMRAAELRNQGVPMEETVKQISEIRQNIRNEFTVDDIRFLNRGGRLSSLVFSFGKMLNIKPLLRATKKGTIGLAGVAHGRMKALNKIVESVKENILFPELQTLYIAHCDALEDANKIAEKVKEAVPTLKNVFISMYDFCTGSHVGPGTIALFYYGKPRTA